MGAVQRCRGPRQNRKFLKKVKGMRDEHQDDIDSGRMLIGMLWNEQWRVKAKKLHWLFSREFYVSSEIYQILLSLTKSEFAAPEGRWVSSRRMRPWWSHILRGLQSSWNDDWSSWWSCRIWLYPSKLWKIPAVNVKAVPSSECCWWKASSCHSYCTWLKGLWW